MEITCVTNLAVHLECRMCENSFNCNKPPIAEELIASASLSSRFPSEDRNNEMHVLAAAFWVAQEDSQGVDTAGTIATLAGINEEWTCDYADIPAWIW